jgi:hypothetical protein
MFCHFYLFTFRTYRFPIPFIFIKCLLKSFFPDCTSLALSLCVCLSCLPLCVLWFKCIFVCVLHINHLLFCVFFLIETIMLTNIWQNCFFPCVLFAYVIVLLLFFSFNVPLFMYIYNIVLFIVCDYITDLILNFFHLSVMFDPLKRLQTGDKNWKLIFSPFDYPCYWIWKRK